jgi:glycerol-3-phosphate dehydrogenase subunit B
VTSRDALRADVLVVGGGMAAAVAALAAREAGASVVLARRAPGATALSSGAISVAPDAAARAGEPVAARRGPLEAARRIAASRPDHPYAAVGEGLGALPDALALVARALGSLLAPPRDAPRLLATVYGTAVPCALCQRSMAPGDLMSPRGTLVVAGFAGHAGFDARLVAEGLARSRAAARAGAGADVRSLELALRLPDLATLRPHELARALEAPGVPEALGAAIGAALPAGAGVVLLPPVLGLRVEARVPERLAQAAGIPVAETLSDVPSVPGVRLDAALLAALAAAGVELVEGAVAGGGPGAEVDVGGRRIAADAWVLATGRFVGGGIVRRGGLVEPVLGLAVQAAEGREAGVHLAVRPAASLTVRDRRAPQPLLSAGLRVDASLRPLDERGRPVDARLFAAGAVIGGHEQASDGTGLGVAILTGYLAGRAAASQPDRERRGAAG